MPTIAGVQEIASRYSLTLPDAIPGVVGGKRLPVRDDAHRLAQYYPATGEKLYDVVETSAEEVRPGRPGRARGL